MLEVVPVIMCGGAGTRLWPLSRKGYPKQYLSFERELSLFQETINRLDALESQEVHLEVPCIVTSEDQRFLVLEQLGKINKKAAKIILEPDSKNTAPALTLAALQALEQGKDPILVVSPSDHRVYDERKFCSALKDAINQAERDRIVVVGISPDKPETGYGYIKVGDLGLDEIFEVQSFVEKPSYSKAKQFLDDGGYLWNAGIFILKASIWLRAIEFFRPEIHRLCFASWTKRREESFGDFCFIRPEVKMFSQLEGESIDYAVMENCPKTDFQLYALPFKGGWTDLGSWNSVAEHLPRDAFGNTSIGDVIMSGCENTLAYSGSRLVGVVGLKDVVVIETVDCVLVIDKNKSQEVKDLVNQLGVLKRDEHLLNRKVSRPWGWYDSVDEGGRFKVKRILVNPGASLSLQKHFHRAEHWIVVSGTAEVTISNDVQILTENQSVYIPLGSVHRLANPGVIPLEIVEVQSGSYLGEDDIVRLVDKYGRTD
jgi:mannose-1-phosphate guanylyltransferase/mannose-6-phosphate isomerase